MVCASGGGGGGGGRGGPIIGEIISSTPYTWVVLSDAVHVSAVHM